MIPEYDQPSRLPPGGSITLVGMAGAGKSTVGKALALTLGFAHLDTDRLMEAYFGAGLQDIFDRFGREAFLQAEEKTVLGLNPKRCVISTGGSVIYSQAAVARLRELGLIVFLRAGLPLIRERVAQCAERGLAIRPGQSLAELFAERQPLYAQAAQFILDADALSPQEATRSILAWLKQDQAGRP